MPELAVRSPRQIGADPGLATNGGSRRLLVACNVALGDSNPYVDLFYQALHTHGIHLAGTTFSSSRDWIETHGPTVDAVHLHWPEYLWRRDRVAWTRWMRHLPLGWRFKRWCDPILRAVELQWLLREMKARGVIVVWTLHNIEPHEGATLADRLGYRTLARESDLIICHSESAVEECRRRYTPRGRVVVMLFGNYDGVYPEPRPRALVRRELGLQLDLPLVTCLGQVRGYKGLDVACRAMERLQGRVQLLVAGKSHGLDVAALQASIARLPGARLIDRVITGQEFADFTAASDLVLLPYRRITGSSALLAALTLGRGVAASDLPFFREILDEAPEAGRLFPAGDSNALAAAIEDYLAVPEADRSRAARAVADQYAWEHVVVPVVHALRELRDQRPRDLVLLLGVDKAAV